MKYLRAFLIVMLTVFTFAGAMAQQVVVKARVGGPDHPRHWHHRHWRHHHRY